VSGATATFQDLSDVSANSWAWTFGDGGTSTAQNPSHTYIANGSYNVCLTVSSGCSTATTCHAVTVCRPLNQAFTQTVSGGTATFQNQSDVSATSWTWDFGDGGTSILQNPLHTYALSGTYNVCLTVSSGCSTATTCHAVTVCRALNEAFTESVSGLAIAFQDQSDASANGWFWDFGDGNTSTAQNPSHNYAVGGTYTVCLTVTSGCATATTCHTVSTCAALNEAFSQTVNGGAVNFQDLSGVSANNWSWDFGDGSTSTVQNPSHTYSANGTYVVCLTVSNGCDSRTVCNTITVCRALNAGFNATSGAGLGVNFQDISDMTATTWEWDFGDGGSSTLQHPAHTYASVGTYNVCLTVSSGCDTATVCIPVTACTPLNENFSHGISGATVSFTDLSDISATSWTWDFGDGNSSTLQNPVHAYVSGGNYTVCLTVSNGCYSATICLPVDLCQPTNPAISFNAGPGLNVDFLGTADPSVNSWMWDFGDGGTSTLQNPSHVYPGNGSYNACLVVANACSTDVTCTPIALVGMEDQRPFTFHVSPNPSAGIFHWELDAHSMGDLSLRIYDGKGALVSEQGLRLSGGLYRDEIDLSSQASGIYLIQVEMDGLMQQVKLIKQ
jgi:PKD repeat protein